MTNHSTYQQNTSRHPRVESFPTRAIVFLMFVTAGAFAFFSGAVIRHLISSPQQEVVPPHLLVQVLDVGDGDAAVIENPGGQTAVIDTGPDKSAAAVVASAISQRLGRQVDLMIVTSTDIRSIGGAADLIPQIRLKGPVILPTDIQTFLAQGGESARSLIAAIKKTGEPAVEWSDYAAKSQARILGSVPAHVAFLKPIRPREGQYYAAMAVKVDFGAETLLYDGGLSGTDEDYIVAQHSPVSCDMLVTARPTDDRTASPELLYLAGPQLVAVQDASDAPAPEALLARIDSAGATVIHTETHRSYVALLDSDPDSTITFKSVPASM